MDSSSVLEQLGKFGRYQKFVYAFVCYIQMFLGFHLLADVFLLGEPKYRCYIDNCDNQYSHFNEEFVRFSIPNTTNGKSGPTESSCARYSQIGLNESCESLSFNQSSIEDCKTYVWDKTVFESTTISEFNLVCDESWYSELSSSVFLSGVLLGSAVFGMVSDRFGRKAAVMSTIIILLTSSTATAFSTTFGTFSFFRFLTAASSMGLSQASYVLGLEYVGISRRVIYTSITQVTYSVGTIVLGVLAYFIRDWRTLEIAISIPGVTLLLCYWVLPESLRWLIANGKHKKATEMIKELSKWNKHPISENCCTVAETDSMPLKNNALDLLKTPRLRTWSLNLFFNWTANSMVYFGLALNTGHIYGDIYANFCWLALGEIFAIVLCTFVQAPFGSRRILFSMLILCGLACASSVFVPPGLTWVSVMIAVVGRGAISASFCAVYLYSSEIFPTTLRSTGIGLSSTISRVGAIIAPYILHLGKVQSSLPMIVFSIISITAGLLTLILPETHKRSLPENIEDAENFGLS